ncbi:MAG TPA: acyl carrier protein [Amycolatopsis sp.]|nr:acyl carrier protein [Amycolatopsis sp.]
MATGETGFDGVGFDLVSVRYHALKTGHDYGRHVRDAGRQDIADFFRAVMEKHSVRAKQCHEYLKDLSGAPASGPAVS